MHVCRTQSESRGQERERERETGGSVVSEIGRRESRATRSTRRRPLAPRAAGDLASERGRGRVSDDADAEDDEEDNHDEGTS